MKEMPEYFVVGVVGLGPAGIMVSPEFITSSTRTLLIDKDNWIGGAAFATDVNLQNINGFPPQSDFEQRTLGSREVADDLVGEATPFFVPTACTTKGTIPSIVTPSLLMKPHSNEWSRTLIVG
jgi:hypothetical protein